MTDTLTRIESELRAEAKKLEEAADRVRRERGVKPLRRAPRGSSQAGSTSILETARARTKAKKARAQKKKEQESS